MAKRKTIDPATPCYICGSSGCDSQDHVLPQALFPGSLPADILKLPAHHACHNQMAEEYFRVIVSGESDSLVANTVWANSVKRSVLRNNPLRQELLSGLHPHVEIRSKEGLWLGAAPGVEFNADKFYSVAEKIVRGLYFHHLKTLLPVGTACRFNWALNEPLTPEREALFVGGVDGVSYPGVFSCRYTHVNEDGGEGSVWWLRFYEALVLRCCTYFQSSVK